MFKNKLKDRYNLTLGLVFSLSIVLVTHGGTGYQQSGILVLLGTGIFTTVTIWFFLKNKFRFTVGQIGLILFILLLMGIPAFTGIVNMDSRVGINFMIMNTLVALVFISVTTSKKVNGAEFISKSILWAATAVSFAAIVIFFYPFEFLGMQFGREGYFRLVGTFSTPNRFGELPAIGLLASLYLFLKYPEKRRRYTVLSLFFLIMSLGSGSKGVLIGLAAGVSVFLLSTKFVFKSTFWKTVFICAPFIIVFSFVMIDYIMIALKLDEILAGRLDVGSGRAEIWQIGQNIYLSLPLFFQLFGFGATGFVSSVGIDAHSTYWNLLFDYGFFSIISISLLLLYIGIMILKVKRNRLEFIFAASLILFCLVRGISMPTIFNGYNISMIAFWAGMAIVVSNKNTQSDKKIFYARSDSLRSDVSLQGSGTVT